MDRLIIRGAREHNLKDVSLDLPRDALIVFTGLSGSGKSSLAFDTIFAEGQRRYVESLSAYARQVLGQMDKPDVDFIEGLSPAVSIDQKSTNRNPRSTVGTITEVHDYLRLLYARAGVPHCPECGKRISRLPTARTRHHPDSGRLLRTPFCHTQITEPRLGAAGRVCANRFHGLHAGALADAFAGIARRRANRFHGACSDRCDFPELVSVRLADTARLQLPGRFSLLRHGDCIG